MARSAKAQAVSTSMIEARTARPRRPEVREAILAAAAAEFLEKGYRQTTIAGIAARAGFTKGAAYSNFGGKHELFAAACSEHFVEIASTIGHAAIDAAASDRDPRRVAEVLTAAVTVNADWQLLLAEFRGLASYDDPEARAGYAQVRAIQRRTVADILRDGRIPLRPVGGVPAGELPELVADLLLGELWQLVGESTADPDGFPTERVTACLTILIDGLLA